MCGAIECIAWVCCRPPDLLTQSAVDSFHLSFDLPFYLHLELLTHCNIFSLFALSRTVSSSSVPSFSLFGSWAWLMSSTLDTLRVLSISLSLWRLSSLWPGSLLGAVVVVPAVVVAMVVVTMFKKEKERYTIQNKKKGKESILNHPFSYLQLNNTMHILLLSPLVPSNVLSMSFLTRNKNKTEPPFISSQFIPLNLLEIQCTRYDYCVTRLKKVLCLFYVVNVGSLNSNTLLPLKQKPLKRPPRDPYLLY